MMTQSKIAHMGGGKLAKQLDTKQLDRGLLEAIVFVMRPGTWNWYWDITA